MNPGDIDEFGRIVAEFSEKIELMGHLMLNRIVLEGMIAANSQYPQDQPHSETDFADLYSATEKLLAK